MANYKFLRRSLMILLFLGACYTTFFAVTNISIGELTKEIADETREQEVSIVSVQATKQLGIQKKYRNHQVAQLTYISSHEVEEPNQPSSLEEYIGLHQYPSSTVTATGYTAGIESTGKTPDHPEYGITYSGVKVTRDLYSTIAADLSVYPIGTILYIPEYGYGVVADKGSAIQGNRLDLYYDTVDDVYKKWGKKQVEVYVIKKGNGNLSEDELQALNETKALQVFRERVRES